MKLFVWCLKLGHEKNPLLSVFTGQDVLVMMFILKTTAVSPRGAVVHGIFTNRKRAIGQRVLP